MHGAFFFLLEGIDYTTRNQTELRTVVAALVFINKVFGQSTDNLKSESP